jgi:hypothetical protein
MPRLVTRNDFQTLNALIAEARALCEAAEENLIRIQDEMQRASRDGRTVTADLAAKADHARTRLRVARARLSRREKRLSETLTTAVASSKSQRR